VTHDPRPLGALEESQLTAATRQPLPRRRPGWAVLSLLMLLRVYVVFAILIVCYAFIRAMLTAQ
jgi:hypothetical protein